MSFKISLTTKGKLGPKGGAEEERKKRGVSRALANVLDEGDDDGSTAPGGADEAGVIVPQGAKRLFAGKPRSTISGPGTLQEEPGHSFGWSIPAPLPGDSRGRLVPPASTYNQVVAKASNLPPEMGEKSVKELFAGCESLEVVGVERIPPSGPIDDGRPSSAMKVTFSDTANPRDLNKAMNTMNDKKYLGRGYYLHLDRYRGDHTKEPRNLPFGARYVAPETPKGVAPTVELGGAAGRSQTFSGREQERLVITAYPPADLETLRLIHFTVEGVLQGGMEFEAALMEDPRVQSQEKYAWLYDQTHPLSRYYRLRLYQMATGDTSTNVEIFPKYGEWQGAPPLPDEFAYDLSTLSTVAGELELNAEEDSIRRQRTAALYPGMADSSNGMLTPKLRTFLIYLLSRLPPTPTSEEIAAISRFAVSHATDGLDEIIDLLVTNTMTPFSLSPANPNYRPRESSQDGIRFDLVPAIQNALRVVSDVCYVTKGGGRSWKYRNAIGAQLRERKVFEYLDTLPTKLRMGLVAKNEYRQFVNGLIGHWKTTGLFDPEIVDHFRNTFEEPGARRRLPGTTRITNVTGPLGQNVAVDHAEAMNPAATVADENHQTPTESRHHSGDSQPSAEGAMTTAPFPVIVEGATIEDGIPGETAAARARRMRPRAEDMFASDEE